MVLISNNTNEPGFAENEAEEEEEEEEEENENKNVTFY
jgi:hypothetical protein